MVEERYAGWSGDLGESILSGRLTLADLAARVESAEIDPHPVSGRQELFENLVNQHTWTARVGDGSEG
jgi:xylose isomerase